MHDLNTINRLNVEAHHAAIQRERAAGKHVVLTYAGLHLVSHQSYDIIEDALNAYKAPLAAPDEHRSLLPALPYWHGAARDQSEDRVHAVVAYKAGADGKLVEVAA